MPPLPHRLYGPSRIAASGCLLLLLVLALESSPVQSHALRPAVVTVTLQQDGTAIVEVRAIFEALIAGIGPRHSDSDEAPQANRYKQLRALPPTEMAGQIRAFGPQFTRAVELRLGRDRLSLVSTEVSVPRLSDPDKARLSRMLFSAILPAASGDLRWRHPPDFGDLVFKVRYADDSGRADATQWLRDGAWSAPVDIAIARQPRPWRQTVVEYLELGFTHILPLGLDHILFVIGLFLLSARLSPLLWQVTAFTIAHTITLGLSIYGVISLSPAIIEPLIAASIVYVGVENIVRCRLSSSRIVLVFCFGLLHGLGFASILEEIGLPRQQFPVALLSFNIGVELGQLAIISIAFLLVALPFSRRTWYRCIITVPLSALISLIGTYWFISRIS